MTNSRAMRGSGPRVAHLVLRDGLGGEITRLREDVDRAFTRNEDTGPAGTGPIVVADWPAPPANTPEFWMGATGMELYDLVIEGPGLTGQVLGHNRNLLVGYSIPLGSGVGAVEAWGYDLLGRPLHDTVLIDGLIHTGFVEGVHTFARVTRVKLPAQSMAPGSVSIGFGSRMGLWGPVRWVHSDKVPVVFQQWVADKLVDPSIDGTFYPPAQSQPDGSWVPTAPPNGTDNYTLVYLRG